MTCAKCGHPLEPVDIPEATDKGPFTEEWQCVGCGARRYVRGNEEEPAHKWDEYGGAVES